MSIEPIINLMNTDELWDVIETIVAKCNGVKRGINSDLNPSYLHCLFVEMDGGDCAGEWCFKSMKDVFKALSDDEFIKAVSSLTQKDYIISVYDK